MAYTKQTWVNDSSPLNATRMNYIEAGIEAAAAAGPAAQVYHSVDQSIPTGVDTVLEFDSENYDNDTIHDTVTDNSRLTCQTAGKYLIHASVAFAGSSAGTLREAYLRLNGVTVIALAPLPPISTFQVIANPLAIYDLSATDYVEALAVQDSGDALDVVATAFSPLFSMVRVSQ